MATEQILERIRRLMRLGASANENEAANAAGAAMRLLELHRIDPSLVGDPFAETDAGKERSTAERGDMGETVIARMSSRSPWRWSLAWAVCEPNGCCPWYIDGEETQIVANGREHDRAAVAVMYAFLEGEVDRLAASHKGNGRSWITSFRYGVVDAVRRRLKKEHDSAGRAARELATGSSAALVRVEQGIAMVDRVAAETKFYMTARGRKYSRTSSHSVGSGDGYSAGRTAGSNLNLGGGRRSIA